LLMSASRGAWLAVVVVAALWAALYWRLARLAVFVGAATALGLIIYVIARGDIMVLGDIPVVDRTLAPMFIRPDRLEVYRNSVYLIQDFPLTGIGLGGQFGMVHSVYALLIQHVFLTYSHNLYLEVWLEQGLVGIGAWLWLMATLYQAARTCNRPGEDLAYQSTWLGLTAVFVHGLSDALPYVALWCWFPFFALLGLNGAILLRRASPIRSVSARRRWLVPAGVVGVFLVTVLISLRPLPATWHANLGCILQARGELLVSLTDSQKDALRRQAVSHYQRAIQVAPGDRTAQQRLGLILVDEARFEDAVEHLEAAYQADPDNTTTHKALGLAYVWVGELEKARPLLQNVPDIVQELNVWGWWRDTQQQTAQSVSAYRMSLLLEPDQPQVRETLERLEEEMAP
jgi:tetratricopeptide (TPR) repeat protein